MMSWAVSLTTGIVVSQIYWWHGYDMTKNWQNFWMVSVQCVLANAISQLIIRAVLG